MVSYRLSAVKRETKTEKDRDNERDRDRESQTEREGGNTHGGRGVPTILLAEAFIWNQAVSEILHSQGCKETVKV